MKIKQHLVIKNLMEFQKGNYHTCFALFGTETTGVDEWLDVGEIELDISVDMDDVRNTCLATIERQEEEVKAELGAKLTLLERAKNELLSLGHDQ
jgi:hypothetical protein